MLMEYDNPQQGFYCCLVTCCCSRQVSMWSRRAFVSIVPRPTIRGFPEFEAKDKIALLIGNDVYEHNGNLECAARDVNILGDILREEMNFKTLTFSNLNLVEMHVALSRFYELSHQGCYCLFYFAGHGCAIENDLYLLPTDAPNMDNISQRLCINVQHLAETLQRSCSPDLTVIIPDTCRVNARVNNFRPQGVPSVRGNVVFAYATTNERAAYERVDIRQSVLAEALQEHLNEPRRVNDMLTSVGDDVATHGHQIVEQRHTLTQNRCLTDRISPDEQHFDQNQIKWRSLHETPAPILFNFRHCRVVASLTITSVLTNCVSLEAKLINAGESVDCSIEIEWKKMVEGQRLLIPSEERCDMSHVVQISNLQKLDEYLEVHLMLMYVMPNERIRHKKRCHHRIKLPFIALWRENLIRR